MRRRRRRGYGVQVRGRAILFIFVFLLLILLFDKQLRPVIQSITANEAKVRSISTINTAVMDELGKDSVTYSDLITVERGSDDNVLSITTNVVKMNELKTKIIDSVMKDLQMDTHSTVGVPVGTLIGGEILHGWGPSVPLRVTLSGNVSADFESSFESAGINQTKHQIYLDVHTSVYSFLPGFDTTTDVNTNVLVAETVIVGAVPEVVADMGGNTSTK